MGDESIEQQVGVIVGGVGIEFNQDHRREERDGRLRLGTKHGAAGDASLEG